MIGLSIILFYYHPLVAAIVLIPAIPLLFSQIKIRANGGSAAYHRDAVFSAARVAGVDDIANRAPQGYETQLGKEFLNGTDLSGGQWQRIALARGLVRNADVIFLDEPTASLDAKTEKALIDQLVVGHFQV